jgi:hypothetical protein
MNVPSTEGSLPRFIGLHEKKEGSILFEHTSYTRAVAREHLGKHVPVAMEMHATIKELLGMVLSIQSVLRCYNWEGLEQRVQYSVQRRGQIPSL